MATGTILLDMAGATPADGTGTGNTPAIASVSASVGAQTTNSPKVTLITWAFGAATDSHVMWSFRMPENYASGGTLFLESACVNGQAAAAEVIWKAALAAVTPGASENLFSKVFGTAATGSAVFNSIGSGIVIQSSVSPGLDSVAAGDMVTLFVGRDADHTMDDVVGDVLLTAASLEYVTS